jgi:ATP-dependent DNA helicase RecG
LKPKAIATTEADLVDQLLEAQEGESLEFKEAAGGYSSDKLCTYCCALANEGGGRVVLGVTDMRPRRVVGTPAFPQIEEARRILAGHLRLRIEVREIQHADGRVLVFEVPPRPAGMPVRFKNVYWARSADSLVAMSEDQLRLALAEIGHDFSADVCPGAATQDLEPEALEDFRRRWIEKSRNAGLALLTHEQLLRDAELLVEEGLTYAALILFGSRTALGRYLAQAEVVFEYRSSENPGPAQQRTDYRQGFFSYYDDLWRSLNLRNDRQHYQDGLFVLDIPTFEERSVREAILNAVSHRHYQLPGSIFIRQYPRRFVIESPGGLPAGVTVENILDRQAPRNRRIAQVFALCGLVERSGQGVNLMFEQSVRQSKSTPSFEGSDAHLVNLTLDGEVHDSRFIRFLEKIGQETATSFDVHDLVLLDLLLREQPIPAPVKPRLRRLVDVGVVESVGRGRGTHYILSKRFYGELGKPGAYTRRRGLGRDENKALLLRHLTDRAEVGCPISELEQVLPSVSRAEVKRLLNELRSKGQVRLVGSRRGAKWFSALVGQGEKRTSE